LKQKKAPQMRGFFCLRPYFFFFVAFFFAGDFFFDGISFTSDPYSLYDYCSPLPGKLTC